MRRRRLNVQPSSWPALKSSRNGSERVFLLFTDVCSPALAPARTHPRTAARCEEARARVKTKEIYAENSL